MAMKAQADAGGKRKPQKIKQDQKKTNSAVSTQAQKKVFADAKRENVLRESQAAAPQKQGAALKTWAEAKQSDPFADLNLQAMKRQFGDSKRAAALQTAAPGVKSPYDGVDFNTKRLNIAKQRQINALKDLESSTGKVKKQESAVRNLNPALNYYVRSTQQNQAAKLDRLAREYGSASTPEAADRIRTEYDKKYSEYLKLNQSSQKAYSDAVNNLRESYAEADRNFQKAKDADEQYQSLLRNADTSSGASAGVSSDMKRRDQAWLQSAEQHMQELDRKISEKEQEKSVKVPEMQYSQGANAGFELLDKYDADIKALQQERQEYADYVELNKKYGAVKYEKDFDEFSRYQSTADKSFHFDTLYEYVNGNTDAYVKAVEARSADSEISVVLKQMTEDEKGTYNYLYAKKGSKAARAYLKELKPTLNLRNRIQEEKLIAEFAEKSNLNAVLASVGSVLTSPLKGAAYIGHGLDYLMDGKIDQNAPYNRLVYASNTVRNTVSQKIEKELGDKWGKVGSFGYQTGLSMLDFITDLLVSKGIGAGVGMGSEAVSNLSLALMGSGAAADTVISAKDRGLSDSQAFTLGTIAGAAEIVTEKVSIEALLDKVSLGENKLWYFLKNTLSEGSEEVGSDIINLTADVLISKDKSEWSQAIKAYRNQGISEKDAFYKALADQAQQMGLDFLGGAVSGGVMAGGSIAINQAQNSLANRAYDRALYRDAVQNGKGYYALNQLTRGELARQNGNLDIEQDYKTPAKSPEVTRLLRQQGLSPDAIDNLMGRQNAAAEYSIETTPDGKHYVKADRQVISGDDPKQWAGQITNYINQQIRNGQDITLTTYDGDLLQITRDTAGKAQFRNLVKQADGKFAPMSDSKYAAKLRAEGHIDELAEVSTRGKKNVPDRNGKHGKLASDGWNYRTAYFEDVDGKYYRMTISTAINGNSATVYNVNRMENSKKPYSINGTSANSGALWGSKAQVDSNIASNNIIPTPTENVNSKSYLSLVGLDPVAAGQMQRRMAAAKTDFEKSVVRWNVSPEKAKAVSHLRGNVEVVFDGTLKGNVNGYYQEGVIHLNPSLSSNQAVLSVFGHELTHSLEKTGAYQDFMEFSLSQIGNETAVRNAVNEKIELYRRNSVELDTTGAMRELVAEYASERLFSDEQTVRRLAQEKPSLARRILAWIKEQIAKLKNDTEKAQLLQAERLYARMLEEARNVNSENTGKTFSLKKAVETAKNLVALHNLTEDKLIKALKLGGFPMPSIAVTKTDIPHTNFGDITLVMSKSTIDPQADRRNKVYSADAWTPTFPSTEYEAEETVADRLHSKYYELFRKFGRDNIDALYPWGNYPEDQLNRDGGEAAAMEKLRDDTGMMKVYLLDNGFDVPKPVTVETVERMSDADIALCDYMISKLGKDFVREARNANGIPPTLWKKQWYEKHGEAVKEAYRSFLEDQGFSKEQIENVEKSRRMGDDIALVVKARNYLNNGPEKRTSSIDGQATDNAIRDMVDQKEYRVWLQKLFGGIEKSSGINTGVDPYTSAGDLKSFRQTHIPATLENIAKVMISEGEGGDNRNVTGFYGVKSLRASTAESFGSIEAMHQAEGKLKHLTQEEADANNDALHDRLFSIIQEIYKSKPHSQYSNELMDMDTIGEILMEAARAENITPAHITKKFSGSGYKITPEIAAATVDLFRDIANMPVNIFEAKPERAVSFDEVLAAIIPSGTNQALIDELHENGVRVVEYEADNTQDRIDKVNSIEGAQFSITENQAVDRAIEMLDNGNTASEVYGQTGLVVTADGSIYDGIGGEKIGEWQNGTQNNFRGVSDGNASADSRRNRKSVDGNVEQVSQVESRTDWDNLREAKRRQIISAVTEHVKAASDEGTTYIKVLGGMEAFSERFYTMLQQGRAVAEQWTNFIPDVQGLMNEIENTVRERDSRQYSISDRQMEGAERTYTEAESAAGILSESQTETDLQKQNRRLLAENERLKRELTLTEKKEPSPGRVRGTAQAILKGYSSKLELPKLYDSLKSLYEFILNGKQKKKGIVINYSFEAAKAEALDIARDILNRSTLKGNSEYKELRSLIRNTRIAVPENIRSDLGETYQDFREAHRDMRFANDGVSVEDLWKTLEEGYPGLFDSKVYSNPADMLLRIAEVMDTTKPFEYNPYESGEADFDTEAEYLANDILERFHTVPERAPTFADMQARKLLKAQQDADRKMLNLMEKMKREKLDAEKKFARLQEDVEAEKEERARKAKAEREHKAIRKLQKETLATLQWLSKNRRKAPADLREKFNEVLADIDLYATHMANPEHWSGKYGTDWAHLADMYEDAKKSDPNFLPSPELDKIVSRLDNKKIFEMDVSALQDLYKAAVGLETEFYNRNKLLGMKQEMETGHMARQSIEDMREAKGNVTKTKTQQFFNEQQLTPMNYLLRMAGWNQDSDFYKMAKQLERGERQVKDYEVRAKRMLESFVKKHKAWLKKADGQGRGATWYKLEVPELQELHMGDKPVFGDTVTVYMTPVQKVHLYLESLNYDNLRHMTGGRTFANKELYSRGKRQKAFEEGTTVRLAPETVKHIVSDLTEEEMALAKALQPYYNEYAAKRINEVSNTLYGYDKAMTKDYAPIYTNANYNKGDFGVYDLTAEGVGNMKERIHGRNPSLNIGALDAFERHVKQTARFVGMAIPARNWTNLMNWQDRNRSFKDEITHRWGLEAKEYIEKLVTDLQGGAIGENGFLESLGNKVLSHYVSAVFGANPGIVFKQAASFPQFAASLGWVNMPKNPIKLIKAAPNELIDAYTSELAYRELGYSTPETAQIKNNPGPLESNKALKFLFAGGSITAMDAGTVKRGWVWAENKVKREYPNLEKGTPEQIKAGESPFYKKVAQEFEDAVALTQPMYDTMHRANIMKNQKGLGKAVTMFRTVPTQIYNLLRRNFGVMEFEKGNYQKAKKSGNKAWIQQAKARKRKAARSAAGAVSALIISNLLLEGIEFLNQLWKNGAKKYKDDDDELTAESFLKQFGKGYVSDLAGTVIFGKELTEFLFNVLMGERWDGIQMPGGEQLNDLIDSVREGGESILKFVGDGINLVQNGGSLPEYLRRHGADYAGAAKTIAEKLSMYLGGFPAENIEKYIMGTIRCFSPELAAAAEGIMKAPEKSELDSLHGNALKRKIQDIFENRGIHISDGALEALYVLYEDGYRDSMPGNTPKSVTVDDEQRELTAAQAQTYDLKWKEIIGNNVNRLTGTAEFQEADADDQERMLDKLYDYATAKAKKAVFPEMEITNIKLDKADAMASAFGSAAGWAAWEVMSANVNSAEKRELLLGLSLPDDQKRAIYELDISDKQGEQIDALEAAELGFDDFLDIQSTYALYNAEDSKASEKALEFSRWVDEQGYTEKQEKAIRDNFVFFAMSPAQESNYDKFTSAGLSEEKAYQLHTELADLDPLEGADKVTEAQKLAWAAFSNDYSSDEKYQALSVLMGDSYAKLQSAKEQGIGVEAFMDFYINRTAIKADKDEDGKSLSGKKDGSKQHKIGTYIDQIPGLTPEQKDYLYKTIYKTGSNLDRTPWHGGAPYTGDLPEHYAVNQNAAQPAPEKEETPPEAPPTSAENNSSGSPSGQSGGGSSGQKASKAGSGTGAKNLTLPKYQSIQAQIRALTIKMPTVPKLIRNAQRSADVRRVIMAGGKAVNTTSEALRRVQDGKLRKI